MGIPLTDDGSVDIADPAVWPLLHLVDGYRDTVGNLLIQAAQSLLPDKLRHDLTHGLISHCILVIELRSVGQIFENLLDKGVGIIAA